MTYRTPAYLTRYKMVMVFMLDWLDPFGYTILISEIGE